MQMSNDQTRTAYKKLSRAYIDHLGHIDSVAPADTAFIAAAFRGINEPILDAGCGPGHLTDFLAGIGHDSRGVDLVPEFIAHARQTYPHLDFTLGDLTQLDALNHSLGGVLAWYSLIHMSDDTLHSALAEFRRVLLPGGVLTIGAFHADVRTPFAHKVTPAIARSQEELRTLLVRFGFQPIRWEIRPATKEQRAHISVMATSSKPHAAVI